MKEKYYLEPAKDTQAVIQLLEDKIYQHNANKLHKDDGYIFSRIIRDENKKIMAGIAGWTWANACEITQLWVDETVRENGFGKMLLEAAEEEAKSKGCVIILVRTYSFQAPHFYERYGFDIQYRLNNFPDAHNYYILTKRIS